MRRAIIGVVSLFVGLGGCSKSPENDPSQSGPKPYTERDEKAVDPESLVLLGTFQARDHAVRVYTGKRYTLENAQGTLIAELITEDTFQHLFPEVYAGYQQALVEDGWAGSEPGRGRFPSSTDTTRSVETSRVVRPAPGNATQP